MRKPSAVAILALLLALSWIGFLANSPQAQDAAAPKVQQWEYTVLDHAGNHTAGSDLIRAGRSGWEAFQIIDWKEGNGHYIYLKRPKQ
jgi:hypothetical protein